MRYYYNTYDPVWGLNNIVNDLFDTWSDNGRRFPPVDVYETDNAYVIEMEVAGYDEEKINMHVEKHILSVKSDEVKSDEDKEYYAREIFTPALRSIMQERSSHRHSQEASHCRRMWMKTR